VCSSDLTGYTYLKLMWSLLILSLIFSLQSSPTPCLSEEEKALYDLMMAYRESKGLEPIPLSAKLTLVAQTHARDLADNYKFDPNNKCNPHSWSSKGK